MISIKRFVSCLFALAILAPATPVLGQTIGIIGDHFTVDRGSGPQPKFLLFISYFDAMRATHLEEDLDYIANTLQFDGIRIFPNWLTHPPGCTVSVFGNDTLIDTNGDVRGDTTPPSGRLQRLIQVIEAARDRGLVVDVSFTRYQGVSFAEYRTGLTRVATLLRPYRNVVFDLQNEADHPNPNQSLTTNQITQLRDRILANSDPAQGDPQRILATSTGGNPSNAVTLAQTANLPFIAFHDARVTGWEANVPGIVTTLRQGNRPVHLQEPEAWNAGQTFCGTPETGDTNPAHFRTAMQNAKQAGAGAWTFHNRLGFILDAGTSFKARVQASSTLKELLEGNPATGVQSFANVAAATSWPITVTLTIDLVGAGAGTVSTTAGLVCSGTAQTCTGSVAPGTSVTLTASPTSGTFVGWGGACAGTTACVITVAADALVTATFSPPPQIAAQYYHSDPIGSVRAVTNQAGAILRRHDYFPFGEEYLPQSGNDPVRFAGKERDAETGFAYFGGRFYSRTIGRFGSIDPMLNRDTASMSPQRWNRYAYVSNRPLTRIDLQGLYEIDVHKHLTRVLAIAAGIDPATATAIAAANQGVDDDPRTGPFMFPSARRDFHFTTPERRNEMWNKFMLTGSADDLGRFLHAQQDSYSHAGLQPEPGHILSHGPDKTFSRPELADRMARDSYQRLVAAAQRLNGVTVSESRWRQIRGYVERFNRAESLAEKERILGELVGFLDSIGDR